MLARIAGAKTLELAAIFRTFSFESKLVDLGICSHRSMTRRLASPFEAFRTLLNSRRPEHCVCDEKVKLSNIYSLLKIDLDVAGASPKFKFGVEVEK